MSVTAQPPGPKCIFANHVEGCGCWQGALSPAHPKMHLALPLALLYHWPSALTGKYEADKDSEGSFRDHSGWCLCHEGGGLKSRHALSGFM